MEDAVRLDYQLSIVIPVFNEELVIKEFLERLRRVLNELTCKYEIVFVNDGSKDQTLPLLLQEKKQDSSITVIDLSRNFGHQIAITAGLDHIRGDAVIVMDADLQDPPEVIPRLVDSWREGYDVVHARRTKRIGESAFKTWSASFYYRLIKELADVDLPPDVGDFRLISKRALEALLSLRERHRYIRGLVAWLGFKQTFIEYVRDRRHAGSTKFSLLRMLRFCLDGLASFSVVPLRLATFCGMVSAFLAMCYVAYAFYIKLVMKIAIPGWTSVISTILFVGGVQLICLGIMGEYLAILYDEIKGRPLYLVNNIF